MLLSPIDAIKKTGLPKTTFYRKIKALNVPIVDRHGKSFFDEKTIEQYFKIKEKCLAKTISFANQKGGIGKTTTCLNLGIALSDKFKKKVFLIDMDPQGNLSCQFTQQDTLTYTVANVLGLKKHGFASVSPEKAIINVNENLDILPANIEFSKFDVSRDLMDYERLSDFMRAYITQYDYILIDCPPTLDIKLLNALVCSDLVIIPNKPSKFSILGMKDITETIETAKQKNPGIKAYSLINEYSERHQISILIDNAKEYFPLLKTKIPRATDIEKAQVLAEHLNTVAPEKFKHYEKLAEEVIEICQS